MTLNDVWPTVLPILSVFQIKLNLKKKKRHGLEVLVNFNFLFSKLSRKHSGNNSRFQPPQNIFSVLPQSTLVKATLIQWELCKSAGGKAVF